MAGGRVPTRCTNRSATQALWRGAERLCPHYFLLPFGQMRSVWLIHESS